MIGRQGNADRAFIGRVAIAVDGIGGRQATNKQGCSVIVPVKSRAHISSKTAFALRLRMHLTDSKSRHCGGRAERDIAARAAQPRPRRSDKLKCGEAVKPSSPIGRPLARCRLTQMVVVAALIVPLLDG